MKARHKKAAGGSTDPIGHKVSDEGAKTVYSGGDSNVVKEARERKKGGKVMGKAAAKRADRKPRKAGGSCTANPYSMAKNTSSSRPDLED